MIGDPEILIATATGCLRHDLKCVHAIRKIGVRVQDAAHILSGDEFRQSALHRQINLVRALAQLGRNEGQTERLVYIVLCPADNLAALMQTRGIESESFPRSEGFKLFEMHCRSSPP